MCVGVKRNGIKQNKLKATSKLIFKVGSWTGRKILEAVVLLIHISKKPLLNLFCFKKRRSSSIGFTGNTHNTCLNLSFQRWLKACRNLVSSYIYFGLLLQYKNYSRGFSWNKEAFSITNVLIRMFWNSLYRTLKGQKGKIFEISIF